MSVICNRVGYREVCPEGHTCKECPHGKPHEPIVGSVTHLNDGRDVKNLCNTDEGSGYCWIGSHDRIEVKCVGHKEDRR